MKLFTLACLTLFFAVGCSGSPARIMMMSPDRLAEVETISLCEAYDVFGSPKVKDELIRRDVITAEEWLAIESNEIKIGMSEAALIASWGKPSIFGSINKTISQYGSHIQWVYRSCKTCKARYVYTENGFITSWQN